VSVGRCRHDTSSTSDVLTSAVHERSHKERQTSRLLREQRLSGYAAITRMSWCVDDDPEDGGYMFPRSINTQ
jgi:hypothetical protein